MSALPSNVLQNSSLQRASNNRIEANGPLNQYCALAVDINVARPGTQNSFATHSGVKRTLPYCERADPLNTEAALAVAVQRFPFG